MAVPHTTSRRIGPLLFVLLAGSAAPGGGQAPDGPRELIVAEIARLDSVWLDAYVTRDVESVRGIVADDFVGQIFQTIMDKDDLLAAVARSERVEAMLLDNLVVNVYEDVAVAHARRRRVTRTPQGLVESPFVYTDVYLFRDGRWQCITGQSAPVPAPEGAVRPSSESATLRQPQPSGRSRRRLHHLSSSAPRMTALATSTMRPHWTAESGWVRSTDCRKGRCSAAR